MENIIDIRLAFLPPHTSKYLLNKLGGCTYLFTWIHFEFVESTMSHTTSEYQLTRRYLLDFGTVSNFKLESVTAQ